MTHQQPHKEKHAVLTAVWPRLALALEPMHYSAHPDIFRPLWYGIPIQQIPHAPDGFLLGGIEQRLPRRRRAGGPRFLFVFSI